MPKTENINITLTIAFLSIAFLHIFHQSVFSQEIDSSAGFDEYVLQDISLQEEDDSLISEELSNTIEYEESSIDKEDDSKKTESKNKEDIELRTVVIKGSSLGKRKKKNIQDISRHTMTASEMKHVPASFGDSVSALTSLPGIMRQGGDMFGPLVIRGADLSTNNYFIDDIPILSPLHFGGMHSVIDTNLIDEIDVYASSFPAEFGSATSSVINISTVDKVERFSGYSDISLFSIGALIQTPILKNKSGDIIFDMPSSKPADSEHENAGYIIASGKYGYISLAITVTELITGDDIPVYPAYWDYQFKSKYMIDNTHSLTLFLFGHKDVMKFTLTDDLTEKGDDPLWQDFKLSNDELSHNQGLYYDINPSKKVSNRIIFFSSLPERNFYINFASKDDIADWAKEIGISSRPWIFGVKDKYKQKWLSGHAEVRAGLGYTLYYFTARGRTLLPTGYVEDFDPGDDDLFISYGLNEDIKNHLYSGYIENKFTIYGLTFIPGFRSDYLKRVETATFDPRFMISYKFPTNTTISAAGGLYSYYFQTNPWVFDENPEVSKIGKKLLPEKARHASAGVEQELGKYSLKVEGFNNYFYDKPEAYPHIEKDGTFLEGLSTGELKAYGFEIMVKRDIKLGQNGLFGWLSYTYTRAKQKTGLPTKDGYLDLYYETTDNQGNTVMVPVNTTGDPDGDKWFNAYTEQKHSLKIVAGYKFGSHIISGRFQFYSGFTYTPVVGGEEDTDYADNNPGEHRYTPVYGDRNSKYFEPFHSLDLRYTYEILYPWGHINWYLEGINIYNNRAKSEHKWYYDRPYEEGSNPENVEQDGLAFLVNFGVEVKF